MNLTAAACQSGVKNCQGAAIIGGVHTNVVVSEFENKLFIVVSQLERLGTLVELTRERENFDDGCAPPTFNTKVLLGKDDPLTHVMARNIVSKIPVSKPILIAMALKDTKPETIRSLEELVHMHRTWDAK